MIMRTSTLAVIVLAVAACKPAEEAAVDVKPTEAPEPISIVRADADIDLVEPEPSLEPLELTVPFSEGGNEFSAAAQEVLGAIIESEQLAAGGMITLGGHTDSGGSDAANIRSSQVRAQAVADWLIERGVSEGRIRTIAFGEQNPSKPNALPNGEPDEAARAANRRVEVVIFVPDTVQQPGDKDAATSLVEQVAAGES